MTTTGGLPKIPPARMQPDIELVRGLVEIPSTSRREGEAVEWLVARMAERGFRASVDDAGNAVGEIGDGPTHVVLLGHIDTVPGEIDVRIEGASRSRTRDASRCTSRCHARRGTAPHRA